MLIDFNSLTILHSYNRKLTHQPYTISNFGSYKLPINYSTREASLVL